RGENTSGVTGGSNTHSHATAGATSSPSGGMVGTGGGGPGSAGAGAAHTHSLAGSSSSANHEPPFIETVLGELGSAEAPPAGIITFWDGTPPGAWDVLSDSGGGCCQRFIEGAANYVSTGGSASHTHANYNAATGSPSSAVNTRGSGNGSGSGHTHSVAISSVSDQNHLPPYIEAVI